MASDPSTDPTVIPAGDWITIVYGQDLLGLANLTTTWTALANQWPNQVPYNSDSYVYVLSTLAVPGAKAGAQFLLPQQMTVAQIYAATNPLSADVSVIAILDNGTARVDSATLQAQVTGSTSDCLAICLSGNATGCLHCILGDWFTLLIVAVLLILLYAAVTAGGDVKRALGDL